MVSGASSEAPATTVVGVDGVGHRFGRLQALDGLTLEVRRGETFGLLGPNGSGKSTLLALLAGQIAVQTGRIEVDGQPLELRGAGWRRWASRLGVIFQSPALDPQLSGRENLTLAAQMLGLRGDDRRDRVERGLASARLTERADERVRHLSGGMRRRLDLARALLHDPDVLLLDEPTTGLDETSFREFWTWLERIGAQRALTILVATHRADEAERCDRVAILERGKLLALDTPDKLRSDLQQDLVSVRAVEIDGAATLLTDLQASLGDGPLRDARAVVDGQQVLIECERGHELIPRLVESLGPGRVAAIELRQATLAEVFLRLTGRALRADAPDGDEAEKERAGKRRRGRRR